MLHVRKALGEIFAMLFCMILLGAILVPSYLKHKKSLEAQYQRTEQHNR